MRCRFRARRGVHSFRPGQIDSARHSALAARRPRIRGPLGRRESDGHERTSHFDDSQAVADSLPATQGKSEWLAALVICPGGGHRFLSIDHEGYDVARWLNEHGIAGFVLKYRLANEPGSTYKVDVDALADVRRAVRLVRSRAPEWGVDPGRLGVMGFSAGGDLAMLSGTRFEKGHADAIDPIDRLDSRPDFLVLIYPGFRPNTMHVTKETPPTFLMVADDDRFCAPGTIAFYQELRKAGVSGELHVYARGGHGFGMRDRPLPVSSWTARLHDWLDERGYLKPRD